MARPGLVGTNENNSRWGRLGRVVPVFYMARAYRDISGTASPASPDLRRVVMTPSPVGV